MYNRYIPAQTDYEWVGESFQPNKAGYREPERSQGRTHKGRDPISELQGNMSQLLTGKGGVASVLKGLHLDNLDSGDVLLLLIVLFLLVEGDELELVIALGLVLIMGLGDEKTELKK